MPRRPLHFWIDSCGYRSNRSVIGAKEEIKSKYILNLKMAKQN
jgi:hypothetical protein